MADRDALCEKMDIAHRAESTQDELDKARDAPLAVEDYFPIIEFTKKETNKVQRSAPPRSSVLTCAEADTMMDMEEKETLVRRKESQGEREITCDNALKIDEAHVNATIKLTAERNETIAVMVKEKEDLVQQRDEACRINGNALATAKVTHEQISFGLSVTDWFKVEFTDLLKQMDDIHKSLRADLDDLHQKTDSMERHECSLVMSMHETNALHAGSRQGDQRERDLETILVAELDAMRQTMDVMSKEKNLLSMSLGQEFMNRETNLLSTINKLTAELEDMRQTIDVKNKENDSLERLHAETLPLATSVLVKEQHNLFLLEENRQLKKSLKLCQEECDEARQAKKESTNLHNIIQNELTESLCSLEQLRVENKAMEEQAVVLANELASCEAELLKCQIDLCGLEHSIKDLMAGRDALEEMTDANTWLAAELDSAHQSIVLLERHNSSLVVSMQHAQTICEQSQEDVSGANESMMSYMTLYEESLQSQGQHVAERSTLEEEHMKTTIKLTAELNALETANTTHEHIRVVSFHKSKTILVEVTDLIMQIDVITKGITADLDDVHQKEDLMEKETLHYGRQLASVWVKNKLLATSVLEKDESIKELAREIEETRDKVLQVQHERDSLKVGLEDSRFVIDQLTEQNNEMRDAPDLINRLNTENKQLKSERDDLSKRIKFLVQEKESLVEELDEACQMKDNALNAAEMLRTTIQQEFNDVINHMESVVAEKNSLALSLKETVIFLEEANNRQKFSQQDNADKENYIKVLSSELCSLRQMAEHMTDKMVVHEDDEENIPREMFPFPRTIRQHQALSTRKSPLAFSAPAQGPTAISAPAQAPPSPGFPPAPALLRKKEKEFRM